MKKSKKSQLMEINPKQAWIHLNNIKENNLFTFDEEQILAQGYNQKGDH